MGKGSDVLGAHLENIPPESRGSQGIHPPSPIIRYMKLAPWHFQLIHHADQ